MPGAHVVIQARPDAIAPADKGGDDIDLVLRKVGFELIEEVGADPPSKPRRSARMPVVVMFASVVARSEGRARIGQDAAARLKGVDAVGRVEDGQAGPPFGRHARRIGLSRLGHVALGGDRGVQVAARRDG